MFKPKKSETEILAETEIKKIYASLELMTDPSEEEYEKAIDQLVKLHKLMESESSHRRISYDKLADLALSALGLLVVVNHERIHVITTKALDVVRKTR